MTGSSTDWTDEEATALLELVHAVSRHRERAPLFDGLNAALAAMFRFDVLGVVTTGPGSDELTPYVVRPRMTLPIFRRSQSALRHVFDTREPLYVRDRGQAAEYPATIAMLERMESHSYLALPLIARDRVIGVLILQSARRHSRTRRSVRDARRATLQRAAPGRQRGEHEAARRV